jgi:Protein of unknown function (DUF2721)
MAEIRPIFLPCITKHHHDLRSDQSAESRTHNQHETDSDVMQDRSGFCPDSASGPSSHDPYRCPHIQKNASGIDDAILFSTMSAIITSLLVIVAFVCAFYNRRHEYAVAVLFVVALGFFTVSLVYLAREARIALNELDHYS